MSFRTAGRAPARGVAVALNAAAENAARGVAVALDAAAKDAVRGAAAGGARTRAARWWQCAGVPAVHRVRPGLAAASVALLLLIPAPAPAQGWVEHFGPGGFGVHRVRTAVSVTIRDRVAQVDVEEWFRNDGPPFGQADYLYPLPASAVFRGYSLWQGDEELTGELLDATEARRIYEEIVRRKRDPALIELAGHGLIRARVFPIATGETRRIRLRYTQVLGRAGDAIEFRYAAGARNPDQPPSPRLPVRPPIRPEVPRQAPLAFTVTIEDGARYGEPFSPTHALRARRDAGKLTVTSRDRLSGDFALFLPFADRPVGIALAAHRPTADEAGWFMLTLSPAEIERARRVPRDVTVVLDVSGSMSGGKLAQAQGAVRQLLETLGPEDRVRLVRFSSGVAAWRPGWTVADAAGLRAARAWVDELRAEGSTNIEGALAQAFAQRSPAGRLGVVLFLTDGLPTVGERDPERLAVLAERGRSGARVFAFGVGYDVNTYLLDRLSAAARGSTQYVRPEEDVETAVSTLAARIQYPVLTDLAVTVAGAQVTELYPSELPDLFAGDELVVFGRYTPESRGGAGAGVVTVSGRRGSVPERYQAQATFAPHAPAHDYIPRLWASRKIGELTQQLRLHGPDEELSAEIRATALRYGVLSEYTSYLVQEPNEMLARAFAAPTAPTASVGRAAVASATSERARREVRSMADLQQADAAAAQRVAGVVAEAAGAAAASTRTVAGRTFREREGVWEDVLHQASARTVTVKAYSGAYFALLRALPELAPWLSELPQVVLAGARVSLRIADERGQEQLADDTLAQLVRDFRGEKAKGR